MMSLLLLPFKLLLIALDLTITFLTFGWIGAVSKFFTGEPLRTVPVEEDESHRVDPRFKGKLIETPREGVATLYDLVADAFNRFGDRKCMGTRQFLGWKVPNKVKKFGDVTWRTYAEMSVEAHKFGASLRAAGVVPAPGVTSLEKVKTSCRIAIFENTCADWLISAMGAFTQSVTVVTVYATLGMDAVVEAVQDNLVTVIVCNKKSVKALVENMGSMKTLKFIVYTSDLVGPDDEVEMPTKLPPGVTVASIEDFIAEGDTEKYPPTPPKPDTTAVIMYTSGSTGKPKGVVINHRQIVGACASGNLALGIRAGEDVYLAYLPLAHIMEMMAEFVMIAEGCTLCYADPKSLTSTGSYPIGALEEFSPTLMIAVPKIWDTIKKGIMARVNGGSPVAKFLVETALGWRNFALKNGFDTPLFKALVFKKFSKVVGGKLRIGLSGGGPCNAEVQDFIRTAFGIKFVQGYGLTETCAGISIQAYDDLRGGIAGVIIPSVECKLESTPEICDKAGFPYLSTDRHGVEGEAVFGRGEIVVRGTNISSGYYMMEDKTKEVWDDDGWFHTGDIGQFMSDGSLRIVDRKKNLVKLKGGEYIALEKMEMVYGNCEFVDAVAGGICCYGDGDMDRPIALIQVSEPVAMKWAKDNGVSGDFETVLKSKELNNAVLDALKKEHAKSDLSHIEKIVAVTLLDSPWTPENGCLTAANKLQRRAVVQEFEKEFEETKAKAIFD